MSYGSPRAQGPLNIYPNGTGSFYWTNAMGPWISFQVVKLTPSGTIDNIDFASSNFGAIDVAGNAGPYNVTPQLNPLTQAVGTPAAWFSSSFGLQYNNPSPNGVAFSDPNSGYWFVEPTFSGTLMTGSATDNVASLTFDLTNVNSMYSRVRIYSVKGGSFILKPTVKADGR